MTEQEAAAVLALLTSAYPTYKMTPATARVYLDFLADLEREDVADACERIVRSDQWFPTVARVREVTRWARRDRAEPGLKALPPPRPSKEEGIERVRKIRAQLRGESDGDG